MSFWSSESVSTCQSERRRIRTPVERCLACEAVVNKACLGMRACPTGNLEQGTSCVTTATPGNRVTRWEVAHLTTFHTLEGAAANHIIQTKAATQATDYRVGGRG